jgi:hypothetical protein
VLALNRQGMEVDVQLVLLAPDKTDSASAARASTSPPGTGGFAVHVSGPSGRTAAHRLPTEEDLAAKRAG